MTVNPIANTTGTCPTGSDSGGNYRWIICALLFFATTVNYLDRQVLSLLAPSLSKEFGWSNTDYANIAAAFQFVYAIALLLAGRIVDRLGTKTAYTLAIVVWSAGAIAHAYSLALGESIKGLLGLSASASVVGFIIARTILAVGKPVIFRRRSGRRPNTSPNPSARLRPAYSIPEPTSVRSWLR
jgi:ACS family hexuronate transporter-like MFS transporter